VGNQGDSEKYENANFYSICPSASSSLLPPSFPLTGKEGVFYKTDANDILSFVIVLSTIALTVIISASTTPLVLGAGGESVVGGRWSVVSVAGFGKGDGGILFWWDGAKGEMGRRIGNANLGRRFRLEGGGVSSRVRGRIEVVRMVGAERIAIRVERVGVSYGIVRPEGSLGEVDY
jgi:hypothetical protein